VFFICAFQGQAECKKFQSGNPAYLHLLSKTPLLNMMSGIMDKFDQDSKLSNEKLDQYRNSKVLRHMKKKQEKQEQIDRCLAMAKECGGS